MINDFRITSKVLEESRTRNWIVSQLFAETANEPR